MHIQPYAGPENEADGDLSAQGALDAWLEALKRCSWRPLRASCEKPSFFEMAKVSAHRFRTIMAISWLAGQPPVIIMVGTSVWRKWLYWEREECA